MRETEDERGHSLASYPNDFDAWMNGLKVWHRLSEESAPAPVKGVQDTATNGHAASRKASLTSKELHEPADPMRSRLTSVGFMW